LFEKRVVRRKFEIKTGQVTGKWMLHPTVIAPINQEG
jgi:hypothetical protein